MDLVFFLTMVTAYSDQSDSPQMQKKLTLETYSITQYLSLEDQETFKQLKLPEFTSPKKKADLSLVAQNFKGISSNLDGLIKQKKEETMQNGLKALEKNEKCEPFEQYQKAVETALFRLLTADENTESEYQPLLPDFKEKIQDHYKKLFLEPKENEFSYSKDREFDQLQEKKDQQIKPIGDKPSFLWLSTNTYFSHLITAFCSGSIIGLIVFLTQK